MLPHNIQRSDDQNKKPLSLYYIFKCMIILIFPACLLESSWLNWELQQWTYILWSQAYACT